MISGSGSQCHVLQHVLIIGGSGSGYDGVADLVTDGTLRRPRGCLLTWHTRYTRNSVILSFSVRFTSLVFMHLNVLMCKCGFISDPTFFCGLAKWIHLGLLSGALYIYNLDWHCVVTGPCFCSRVCREILSSLNSRALFQIDLIDSISVSCLR